MAATQLSLYNGALVIHLGADPMTDTDPSVDNKPEAYALDKIWNAGAVDRCLRMGQWNFAARSMRIEYDPNITPEYGYQRAHQKPGDFVRVMGVCEDEYYRRPLRDYQFESGYWWCDLDQLYVRFVSNDAQYGGDLSVWTEDFEAMVECYLALQVAKVVQGYRDHVDALKTDFDELKTMAKSTDAQEQAPRQNPEGSWTGARRGNRYTDRTPTGSLTG